MPLQHCLNCPVWNKDSLNLLLILRTLWKMLLYGFASLQVLVPDAVDTFLWPSYYSWGCLIFSSNHFMNVYLRLMICWARSCCVFLWKYISFLIAYKSKFHKLFLLVTRWNFMILKSWHRFFLKRNIFWAS